VSLGLGIVGTASPGSLALGRPQARLRPGQRFRRANAADFGPVRGGDDQQILDSDVAPTTGCSDRPACAGRVLLATTSPALA
jgi:hypothetical protein